MQDNGKTMQGKYLLTTEPGATTADVVRAAHRLGADIGLSDAEKARLDHYEAHREERELEDIRRRAVERPLSQYDRGLYTVEELVERLIIVSSRDFSDCLAGDHRDERARVKHQTDWWQCTTCDRLEPMTRGEKVAAGLIGATD